MLRLVRTALLASALASVGACSGGASTPTPTPPPPGPGNRAPVFTSAAAATIAENSGGTVYMATATDADGNALTFSLAGGADQNRFAITAAGALSFATPPDFEHPNDADGNNVYLVRIAVSDGATSTTLDLAVTIANVGPDAFRVTRVGTGFAQPLFVAPVPDNSGRVFVVERGGRIRILTPATGAVATFLDITGQTTTDGERGLLGFATAPDFAASGNFYIFLTNTAGDIEVRRYQTLPNLRDVANPATADLLLTIPHSTANNHNGGWIGFGPDGFLYIAVGDGGGAGDPPNNAQNTNVLLGKMLRIDVGGDDFPNDAARDYRIPAGNPFAGAGGRPEIWAFGLRNPYRASFDFPSQTLWIGDVGQNMREEIDVMSPQSGGANFGWRVMEGTAVFNGAPTASMLAPEAEYLHGTGPRQGNSITGGYVYRGPVEALQGQYFFGDFVTGNLWSILVRDISLNTIGSDQFILRRADFTPNQGAIGNIASFGVDQAGNLYIVDFDGDIFRVEQQ